MQIQDFYDAMFNLFARDANMDAETKQREWGALFEQYPFGEYILLSRKEGDARDEAFAWNVLNRIPPGQTKQFAEYSGLDYRLLQEFYDNKGDLSKMPESDRNRFMQGMLDASVVLSIPDTATKHEWERAQGQYKEGCTDF